MKFNNPFKINKLNNKKYQKKCIEIVNSLSVNDTIKGFINCSIDKKKLFNKIVDQLNKNAMRNRQEKYITKYKNDSKNIKNNTIT